MPGGAGLYRLVGMRSCPAILAYVFTVVTIGLSGIHSRHDADSLLLSLISIERYAPYYWGDNRYGMLVPLLAAPVRDYVWNLLIQTLISTAATGTTVVLFQCFFLDREHGFTARNLSAACITCVLLLLLVRPGQRAIQIFFFPHPYFSSLATLFIGLILAIRSSLRPAIRYTGASAAFLLSFWINWTNAPLALALATLLPSGKGGIKAHLRQLAPALLLIAGSFLAMYALSRQYPALVEMRAAPVAEWQKSASTMWRNTRDGMLFPARLAVLSGAAALIVVIRRRKCNEAFIIILLAICFAGAIATSEWVTRNQYEWRYWTVPIMLVLLSIASLVADAVFGGLEALFRSEIIASAFCGVLLVAATLLAFGWPSVSKARAGIDIVSGRYYDKVKQLRCTHMLGDYWVAWSSVFYNRSHRIQPPLWAISLRSGETAGMWSKTPLPERRYCGICGDYMNNYYIIVNKLGDLRHTSQTGDLCLYQH
jgi:hypothetical protein